MAHDVELPKALDITYGAAEYFCKCVSDLTEGRFQIQQFAAGEIVPGLQALDAVQNDTVEMAYTGALFYAGKDPTFALGASVPVHDEPASTARVVLSRRRQRALQ